VTQESSRSIDLNADLGEHDGGGFDADFALLDVVSSASIACGSHAGSAEVMRATVAAAYERGVTIGAHPGYPDREGFGRRETGMAMDQILASLEAQIELLSECCAVEGARMRYVKPHGALYNRAAKDQELARLVAERIARFDSSLVVLAPAASMLQKESLSYGLTVAREAFIDRAYLDEGTLLPRERPGAVIDDPSTAADRAVGMIRDGTIRTIDGRSIRVEADSLCVHSDSRNALETVRLTRARLEHAGFAVRPFAR
jgi:UPF0271 protein